MGVFLNGQNKPLGEKEITEGTPTQTTVYVRCVIEEARHFSTAAVVLVHNHPFGNPEPSAGEEDTTRTSDRCQVFGFRFPGCVTPHLIIGLKRKPNSEDLALFPRASVGIGSMVLFGLREGTVRCTNCRSHRT